MIIYLKRTGFFAVFLIAFPINTPLFAKDLDISTLQLPKPKLAANIVPSLAVRGQKIQISSEDFLKKFSLSPDSIKVVTPMVSGSEFGVNFMLYF